MFLEADKNFQGHVVGSSVVIYLGQYMHQSAWGQVWRLPDGGAPVRVKPTPVHNVNIDEALARGDLKGTGFELLAHTLAHRGCSSPSMMSPLLVVLTSNSAAFTGDQRALKDVDSQIGYTAQIHKNIRHVIDALRNTPRNRRRVSKNAFRAYILAKNGAYI
jgi:hypothetical protein